MIQADYNRLLNRAKDYVKENWGSPFIMGFMLLLISAGVSLSLGLSILADNIAVYAFYALVVGVVLQLVCYLKYGKSEAEDLS